MEAIASEVLPLAVEELQPIIDCKINDSEFLLRRQQAYFFQGRSYKELGEFKKAWTAYCSVKDKNSPAYSNAISARVSLLKAQVATMVNWWGGRPYLDVLKR